LNQDLAMPLALCGHPFSPSAPKVLMALYETDTPEHFAESLKCWPMHIFAMLLDGERQVVGTRPSLRICS
jgi:hypothetical protein